MNRIPILKSARPGVSIGTVHPGDCSWGYHESVLRTLSESPFAYHLISAKSGVLIAGARNHVVERFLDETEDDYLLFVDSDVEWNPDAVEKLVSDGLPVVGGLYVGHSDSGDLFPVFNVDEDGRGRKATFDDFPASEGDDFGVLEVHGVGMGFCLIRRDVLEKLGTRLLWPFEEIVYRDQAVGEDITFCIRARSAGFKTYVDLDARVGHRKAVTL